MLGRSYDAAGRMVQVMPPTFTLVYTYNHQDLRVAQNVAGEVLTFTWDLASPLAQVLATSDGVLNLYGLARIGEKRDGEWAYSLGDALNSVRQWADGDGDVTYAAGYRPFGVVLWEEGSSESAWKYTGEWADNSTELTYLRARWYDGATGQFTQKDLWPGKYQQPLTMNPYLYALANPVLLRDPSGHSPFDDVMDVLGRLAVLYYREYYPQELATSAQRFSIDRVELEAGLYTMGAAEGLFFDFLREHAGIRQDIVWAWLAWGSHTTALGYYQLNGCTPNPVSDWLEKQGRRADIPSLGIAQIDPDDAIAVAGYWAQHEGPNTLPPPGPWPNEWLGNPDVGIQYLAAYIGWSYRELERFTRETGWTNSGTDEGWFNLEKKWWFTGKMINGDNPTEKVREMIKLFQLGPTEVDGYVQVISYWERKIAPDNKYKTGSRYVRYMRRPVPRHLKLSNILSSLPQ